MERLILLHIERLPEGVYLATSDDVQGLLAEGRTVQEAVEIARDIARILMEMDGHMIGEVIADTIDLPVVIAA